MRNWWDRLKYRVRSLRRGRMERDLDDELRFHFEQERQLRMDRGLTVHEAERSASRDFGNVLHVEEATRDMWGWQRLERIGQDLRYAFRSLRRRPGFTITAVISLGLGIGATVASFSMADAFLLRPLAIARPAEVVAIHSAVPEHPLENIAYADLRDLRNANQSFQAVVGHTLGQFAFAEDANATPQIKFGMKVTRGFFSAMGIQPALGRGFLEEESSPSARELSVVLSHSLWQQLGGQPSILGRTLRLNGTPARVVGVLPEAFTGMDPFITPALYVPFEAAAVLGSQQEILEDRDSRTLTLRARLKGGVSLQQAQQELGAFSSMLQREHPTAHRDRLLQMRTELALRIQQSPPLALMVTLLSVLAVLVLLIACANVASLLMARARARQREIAIRTSIGAGRARLIQQFMTESVVLAVLGGVAGVLLASGFIRFLSSFRVPTDTPIAIQVQVDHRVLLFSLVMSVLSALIFGVVPCLRSVKGEANSSLRQMGGEPASGRRARGGNVLVSAQVAVALVLLVVSAALLDAFRKMTLADPGMRTDHVMMFEFNPALAGYTPERSKNFFIQLLDRTRVLPAVQAATLSRAIPFRPNFTERAVVPEGYDFPRNQSSVTVSLNFVDESYFDVMRVPLVAGRAFSSNDTETAAPVVIVNQEFARRYWNNSQPVGRRLHFGSQPWMEVVGVARNAKYSSLAETPQPFVYVPFRQQPQPRMTLLVATAGAPAAVTNDVLTAVRSLDRDLSVFNVRPLDEFIEQGVLGPSLTTLRMVLAAGVAGLMLAMIGLYGLVAYSVSRRTREIGIRMAIGANRSSVLSMVLRQGLGIAAWGIFVGMVGGVPLFRALSGALSGLGGLNVTSLLAAPAVLVIVTVLACLAPAYRASRIDPTTALRSE